MEANQHSYSYQVQAPYPEIRVQRRNLRYAEAMLSNIGGANSEISAVSLYFYDHLVTVGVPELTEAFHDISLVEMHHLEIFGTLAQQLGADPRLWSTQHGRRVWWSPDYNRYARKLGPLMHNAIQSEQSAIRKYENQLRWIQDQNIQDNLRRIIQDEKMHLERLTQLCDCYINGPDRWQLEQNQFL